MELILPALTELLQVLILAAVLAVTGLATAWVKERLGVEKMQKIEAQLRNKESIAYRSLMLMREALEESGLVEQNLDRATEWASKELKKMNIKVTPDELQDLIKSMYNEMKDEFIEQWEEITVKDEEGNEITYRAKQV